MLYCDLCSAILSYTRRLCSAILSNIGGFCSAILSYTRRFCSAIICIKIGLCSAILYYTRGLCSAVFNMKSHPTLLIHLLTLEIDHKSVTCHLTSKHVHYFYQYKDIFGSYSTERIKMVLLRTSHK